MVPFQTKSTGWFLNPGLSFLHVFTNTAGSFGRSLRRKRRPLCAQRKQPGIDERDQSWSAIIAGTEEKWMCCLGLWVYVWSPMPNLNPAIKFWVRTNFHLVKVTRALDKWLGLWDLIPLPVCVLTQEFQDLVSQKDSMHVRDNVLMSGVWTLDSRPEYSKLKCVNMISTFFN